jgi:hypothetical protein
MDELHSPAPWKILPGSAHITVMSGTDAPVARYIRSIHDGALIVAAPDLLASLKVMVAAYVDVWASGDCGHWDPESEDTVKAARAAIAKAEGR